MPTTTEINSEIQQAYDKRQTIIDNWRDVEIGKLANDTVASRGIIRALHEHFSVQERLFADMSHMKNMLSIVLKEAPLDDDEKNYINNYLVKLNKLTELHQAFNSGKGDVIAALSKPDVTLENAITVIEYGYGTVEMKKFYNQLGSLALDVTQLDAIVQSKVTQETLTHLKQAATTTYSEKTISRNFAAFSAMPGQFITRMEMNIGTAIKQSEDVIKERTKNPIENPFFTTDQITKAHDRLMAVSVDTKKLIETCNLQVGATTSAETLLAKSSDPKEMKIITLRRILSLNMNTNVTKKDDKDVDHIDVRGFDSYLQTVLLKAYSDHFQLDPRTKEFSIVGKNYGVIHEALGIDMHKTDRIVLDPKKFNADLLDKLYKGDENPLWLVLKSTKPVDAQFTAAKKIKSYEEIALEFKKEKIGATEKSVGAFQVVKAAKAIATEYGEVEAFKSAFAPGKKDGLGAWFVKKGKKDDRTGITQYLTQSEPTSQTKLSQSSESFAPSFNSSNSSSSSSLSDFPELSVASALAEQPWTPDIRPQAQEALDSEEQLNKLEQMKLQLHTIQQELSKKTEELEAVKMAPTSQMQQVELQLAEAKKTIHEQSASLTNELERMKIKLETTQQELSGKTDELASSQQALESEKKAHSSQMQEVELRLAAAQQTIQEQSTSLTQEQNKSEQLATDLGSAKGEIKAHIAEEEKLISKAQTLQDKLIEVRQNIQDTEAAATALTNRKILLAVSVGSMGHILNRDDNRTLPQKIMAIKSTEELESVTQQVESLNKINRAVNGIIKSLEKRDGFFNSAPVKKINAIKEAFQTLSLEQKIELSQLDNSNIKDRLNDKDPIAAFLKAVNQNRALIGISSETTSFKEFKNELSGLKAKHEEAPEVHNANGPGVL